MKIVIVSDFDNTITLNNGLSALGTLEKILPDEYRNIRLALSNEQNNVLTSNITEEKKQEFYQYVWQEKHKCIHKYGVTLDTIKSLLNDVTLKDNFDNFLKYLNKKRIPFIINSAGLGDYIEEKLKEKHLLLPNVKIISNWLFKKRKKYITNFNKKDSKEYLNLINGSDVLIIIGDNINDLSMIPDNYNNKIIKVAFNKIKTFNYNKYFDYVIEKEDFNEIINIVKEVENEKD